MTSIDSFGAYKKACWYHFKSIHADLSDADLAKYFDALVFVVVGKSTKCCSAADYKKVWAALSAPRKIGRLRAAVVESKQKLGGER